MIANPLSPGSLLRRGKYRVVRPIGGGGMARVYLVEEMAGGKCVQRWAMKELLPPDGGQEELDEAVKLFKSEAEMLGRLKHPNLPSVAENFEESKHSYLVMEYIEGENLEKRMEAAGGRLPEAQVLEWGIALCEVLQYLHSRRPPIIFRDMKPANVMVTTAGEIKLIDFGIARTYKAGKKKDTVSIGSANYAPPEQFGAGQTEARSDIYALGATLYHLLTGNPPAVRTPGTPTPMVRILNPQVSVETEQAMARAMAYEMKDRYQTAKEMAAALAQCRAALTGKGAAGGQAGAGQPWVQQSMQTPAPWVPSVATDACPVCGTPHRPGAHFCGRCGAHLGGQLAAVLFVQGPNLAGREVRVQKSPFTLGRSSPSENIYPDLDLSPYDTQPGISRRHAQIEQLSGGYVVVDAGSSNGTFVNGVRLTPGAPQPVRTGDRITIGRVTLTVRLTA